MRSPFLRHAFMTLSLIFFPGARYVSNTGEVKASTPVQSETIPEGVVLTLRAAMKGKSYSIDEHSTLSYGRKQYKASDVLAIIRKEDGAGGESSINTRRSKHCFMQILGLIVSDKHRGSFFQSRLSCSTRELDNKETGKNRRVWVGIAEDYRSEELEVTATSSTSGVPELRVRRNRPVSSLVFPRRFYLSLCIISWYLV